jgi:hypothetical protein
MGRSEISCFTGGIKYSRIQPYERLHASRKCVVCVYPAQSSEFWNLPPLRLVGTYMYTYMYTHAPVHDAGGSRHCKALRWVTY